MAEVRIRPIGRPKVERGTNGLRKITRKYVVDGIAVAANTSGADPNIEDDVFLPFGTIDDEYVSTTQDLGPGYESMDYTDSMGAKTTNAYLVGQEISPSEEVSQAFLVRIYQELEATPDPVQVEQDEIKVNDSGRLVVRRKFIVKNTGSAGSFTPFMAHYDPGRVGNEDTAITITVEGEDFKCFLGGVESKETEVYTEFTEVYFQDAVLSETIEYKNGLKPLHKLEIRTIRAIAGSTDLTKPAANVGPFNGGDWFLISEREGPGSANFGQVGKPISTKVWAKGEGIISQQHQVKHNGALHLVVLKSLGSIPNAGDISGVMAPAYISPNGAAYVMVDGSSQESSGHQVHTTTFAAGFGLISTASEEKGLGDSKIEIKTEVWLTPRITNIDGPPVIHGIDNPFRRKKEERAGYVIHTITGTSDASGTINTQLQKKNQGKLWIATVRKIGSAPVVDDIDIGAASEIPGIPSIQPPGTSWTTISTGTDTSGNYPIHSAVFANGKGTIITGIRNTGSVTMTSYTSLDEEPTGTVYDKSWSDRDGYTVWTWKTYEADATYDSKSKQWLNKTVYRETTNTMIDEVPGVCSNLAHTSKAACEEAGETWTVGTSALAADDSDVSGSYSLQVPGVWRKAETAITAGDPFVIQTSTRYNADGYFTVTKVVASADGYDKDLAKTWEEDGGGIKPPNSCLMASSTAFERGWVRDSFTWMALSDAEVEVFSMATSIPWTLPGHAHLQEPFPDAFIDYSAPKRVHLPVVKKTKLSTAVMAVPPVLGIPSIHVKVNLITGLKNTSVNTNKVLHNWVWTQSVTTMGWTDGFWNHLSINAGEASISGTAKGDSVLGIGYNGAAANAFLSASLSTVFTDGVTTIYKLDTTQGSPTLA